MPRQPVKNENTEDQMQDAEFEDWEVVSEGFGSKIVWDVGTVFIGTFRGTRLVPVDDKEDGFSEVTAAEFTDRMGEKFWCWLPYQLKEIIETEDEDKKLNVGDEIYIKCTGESETKRGLNPVKTFSIKRKPR